jgi:hypothetical protein
MTDERAPSGILLGLEIICQRPVPQEAVDAYLAWLHREISYAAMAKVVSGGMLEIIAPLVESEDPHLINFRTGLSLGFFERVADGVREATGSPVTGEEIKDRVFARLKRRPEQSRSLQQAAT